MDKNRKYIIYFASVKNNSLVDMGWGIINADGTHSLLKELFHHGSSLCRRVHQIEKFENYRI